MKKLFALIAVFGLMMPMGVRAEMELLGFGEMAPAPVFNDQAKNDIINNGTDGQGDKGAKWWQKLGKKDKQTETIENECPCGRGSNAEVCQMIDGKCTITKCKGNRYQLVDGICEKITKDDIKEAIEEAKKPAKKQHEDGDDCEVKDGCDPNALACQWQDDVCVISPMFQGQGCKGSYEQVGNKCIKNQRPGAKCDCEKGQNASECKWNESSQCAVETCKSASYEKSSDGLKCNPVAGKPCDDCNDRQAASCIFNTSGKCVAETCKDDLKYTVQGEQCVQDPLVCQCGSKTNADLCKRDAPGADCKIVHCKNPDKYELKNGICEAKEKPATAKTNRNEHQDGEVCKGCANATACEYWNNKCVAKEGACHGGFTRNSEHICVADAKAPGADCNCTNDQNATKCILDQAKVCVVDTCKRDYVGKRGDKKCEVKKQQYRFILVSGDEGLNAVRLGDVEMFLDDDATQTFTGSNGNFNIEIPVTYKGKVGFRTSSYENCKEAFRLRWDLFYEQVQSQVVVMKNCLVNKESKADKRAKKNAKKAKLEGNVFVPKKPDMKTYCEGEIKRDLNCVDGRADFDCVGLKANVDMAPVYDYCKQSYYQDIVQEYCENGGNFKCEDETPVLRCDEDKYTNNRDEDTVDNELLNRDICAELNNQATDADAVVEAEKEPENTTCPCTGIEHGIACEQQGENCVLAANGCEAPYTPSEDRKSCVAPAMGTPCKCPANGTECEWNDAVQCQVNECQAGYKPSEDETACDFDNDAECDCTDPKADACVYTNGVCKIASCNKESGFEPSADGTQCLKERVGVTGDSKIVWNKNAVSNAVSTLPEDQAATMYLWLSKNADELTPTEIANAYVDNVVSQYMHDNGVTKLGDTESKNFSTNLENLLKKLVAEQAALSAQ